MTADLLLSIVQLHGTLIWSAASGAGALAGAYLLMMLRIRGEVRGKLLVEKEKLKDETVRQIAVQEAEERAAFRASLMAELGELRQAVRDCEADRRVLTERINSYNGELKLLEAECNIMKMQMKYLTENASRAGVAL